MCVPASLHAQGLPELGATPGTLRAEDLVPAEMAEYAKRKWMWTLADLAGDSAPSEARLKDAEPKKSFAGWMVFGRFGVLRWQNDFAQDDLSAFSFGLRHSPPRLQGNAYIGIYRRF